MKTARGRGDAARPRPHKAAGESTARRRGDLGPVAACFFLSGAASLVLEVVWTRQLRLVFGSTTLAISTVLAAYMLGLGLGGLVGARFAKRLANGVRTYGWIEIGVGAYALVVPWLLLALPAANYALVGALPFWPAALCRFLVALVVLLLPTILMGATLPVLVEELVRRDAEVARRVGFLYGLNTLGAVAGVVGATFVLLPVLGIFRTNLAAALADVAIGAVALLWLARRFGAEAGAARDRPGPASFGASSLAHPAILAYALVGFTSLTYEVCWSRALSMILGSSIYAFASMLAAFLTGIALGSLVARWWFDRLRRPMLAYAGGIAVLGLLSLLTVIAFRSLPAVFVEVILRLGTSPLGISATNVFLSMLAMLGPTLVLGALFPLLIRVVARTAAEASSAVGSAYFANTLGSATGAFAAGFALIPLLGLQRTLAVAVALNFATAALLMLWQREWRGTSQVATAAAGMLLAGLVVLRPPGWSPEELARGVYRGPQHNIEVGLETQPLHGIPPNELLYYREGINTTVSVHRYDGTVNLRVNGKTDASTGVDMGTQILLGEIGMLFGGPAERVLVIGLASGITVGSVALHEPRHLDVVDLEPAMVEASQFFNDHNHRPLERPGVHLLADDGRNVLAYTREPYDLIVSEPSNPWITGAASLFTREFFAAARAALRPGGQLLQWVHLYSMPGDALRSILASLGAEFPYVYGFVSSSNLGDVLLLARDRPLEAKDLPRWDDLSPAVRDDLMRIGLLSGEDLWALLSYGPEGLRQDAGAWQNTDDNLYVETLSPWALYTEDLREGLAVLEPAAAGAAEVFARAGVLSAESAGLLAWAYASSGKVVQAQAALALARAAGDSAAADLTAALLEAEGDEAELRRRLDEAAARHPAAFLPRVERATLRLDEKEIEGALADAEVAVAARPSDPRARFLRLRALNALDRSVEARSDAAALATSAYVAVEPDVLLEASQAAASSGDLPGAIALVRRFNQRRPGDAAGWYVLGEYLRRAGNEEGARQAEDNQRRAVRNAATRKHIDALRAEHAGYPLDAIALLESALALDPGDKAAEADLRRLQRR